MKTQEGVLVSCRSWIRGLTVTLSLRSEVMSAPPLDCLQVVLSYSHTPGSRASLLVAWGRHLTQNSSPFTTLPKVMESLLSPLDLLALRRILGAEVRNGGGQQSLFYRHFRPSFPCQVSHYSIARPFRAQGGLYSWFWIPVLGWLVNLWYFFQEVEWCQILTFQGKITN